ncbi:MAG: plastocyanin/azurin family copper-binding protein [Thermoleophilaceae bacterium]
MRIRRLAVLVAGLVVLGPASAARADEEVTAAPFNRFTAAAVTIDQGEKLTFRNTDGADHNVTARDRGEDGRPLFASQTIGDGRSSEVDGVRFLTTGSYAFLCTIHPSMTGTLNVSSAGTPLQRPAADTTAPSVAAAVRRTTLARVARSGRLTVNVRLDEAARVTLRATTRIRGRTVRLARRAGVRLGDGRGRVTLRLSRRARRTLGSVRRAVVTVEVRAVDAAGNGTSVRARRTLRS